MAYIEVIQPEEVSGKLKTIYDDLIKSRGKLAEVHKIQSLNPESIVNHMDLYMTIMFGKSELKRYQREMMAVIVSKCNDCHYCQTHHGEALNHFWKDENRVEQLRSDYTKLDLNQEDLLWCDYAKTLTNAPSSPFENDLIKPLKKLGVSDGAILDATLVIAYFNFVNRIVMGLGVDLESDEGAGYKYD